jgi:hypothetical protein
MAAPKRASFAGRMETVILLIGTCWKIGTIDAQQREMRNMRKIIMLAALALVLAAEAAAIVVVDTQQAMACRGRYCP